MGGGVHELIVEFFITEYTNDGSEALAHSTYTTVMQCARVLSAPLGNQINGFWHPSVSANRNYIIDDPSFRLTVFYSYLVHWGLAALSYLTWFFLPGRRAEVQRQHAEGRPRLVYCLVLVIALGASILYGATIG